VTAAEVVGVPVGESGSDGAGDALSAFDFGVAAGASDGFPGVAAFDVVAAGVEGPAGQNSSPAAAVPITATAAVAIQKVPRRLGVAGMAAVFADPGEAAAAGVAAPARAGA